MEPCSSGRRESGLDESSWLRGVGPLGRVELTDTVSSCSGPLETAGGEIDPSRERMRSDGVVALSNDGLSTCTLSESGVYAVARISASAAARSFAPPRD